jgi:hypothetical protein
MGAPMTDAVQQPRRTDAEIVMAWRNAKPRVRDEVLKILTEWQAIEQRERDAIIRAETAEQQVCTLTRDLDRAHRLIERLRAQAHSMGGEAS